jgi:uncharacterized membrane protein YpjA
MAILCQRWLLTLVVILNVIGTVWGFFWYRYQLQETAWYLLPFVPDCPLHALVFALFACCLLTRDPLATIWKQTFAWIGVLGSIKYGIWTVVILGQFFSTLASWPVDDDLLLFISHSGMLLQGMLYARFLPETIKPAMLAISWFVANDFFDYVLNTHPLLPLAGQYLLAGWLSIGLTAALIVFTLLRFRFSGCLIKE